MRSRQMLGCFLGIAMLAWPARLYADEPAPSNARDLELRLVQNSFSGSTGSIRLIDAASGPKGTFRVALNTEFFVARDVFVPDDRAQHFAGNLSLSVAAARFLEVFVSAEVTSAWDDATDPRLVQRVADARLGLKGYHWVTRWVAVGADATVLFPGGVGDMRETFRATSFGFRANASLDFRARSDRHAPVIVRFNAQYWFDNTAKLTNSIQSEGPLIPFQRFAYGINEVDTVRIGTGLELPLRAGKVGVHPLVDWRWDLPVNRQGFRCSAVSAAGDRCLSDVGVKAFPMTLTLGVRLLTPPTGLAVTVGADVGLTGTDDFVQQLAPTAPYNVIVGLSYAIDARRTTGHTAKPTSTPSTLDPRGRVYGVIVDEHDGRPVEDALVTVTGEAASAQVTDEGGRFVTYALPVGEIELEVSHPDYEPGLCLATLDASEAGVTPEVKTEVQCVLTPTTLQGTLRLHVVGKKGRSIPALPVVVQGASEARILLDDSGKASAEVDSGTYVVFVDDPAYLVALTEVEVAPRAVTEVVLQALRKPNRPRVVVRKREIVLRSQISFATGSNEILPNSEPLLLEIADTLLRDPSLELVEIQGHTDNRGNFERNMQLSENRANAVRAWLVEHGVEGARLQAKGYGPTRPVVPNITAHNRARNRRVQFKIVRRAGATVAATR
ncbi:MAG: OmpA family protein [Myxococcota bacterium]